MRPDDVDRWMRHFDAAWVAQLNELLAEGSLGAGELAGYLACSLAAVRSLSTYVKDLEERF